MSSAGSSRFLLWIRRTAIFLLILLIALLLHMLPMVLFSTVKTTAGKEQADRRFTVMVNNVPSAQYDPYDLHYWLTYGDPMRFARPDPEDGFTSFLRSRNEAPGMEDSETVQQISLTRALASPENRYEFRLRTPGELLHPLRPPMPRLAPEQPKEKPSPPIGYPRWTAADGTDLGNLFLHDESIPRRVRLAHPKGPTVLLFYKGENDMPPHIKVRQSCGNAQLDVLASAALSSYAKEKLGSPELDHLNYVIVDWETGRKGNK